MKGKKVLTTAILSLVLCGCDQTIVSDEDDVIPYCLVSDSPVNTEGKLVGDKKEFSIPGIEGNFYYQEDLISNSKTIHNLNYDKNISVLSAYLYDANKDGYLDICYIESIGFGYISYKAEVFDVKNQVTLLSLDGRGAADFRFSIENDDLIIEKFIPSGGNIYGNVFGKGSLKLDENGNVFVEWKNLFNITDYSFSLIKRNKDFEVIPLEKNGNEFKANYNTYANYYLDVVINTKSPQNLPDCEPIIFMDSDNNICSPAGAKINENTYRYLFGDTRDIESIDYKVEFCGIYKNIHLSNVGISPDAKKISELIDFSEQIKKENIKSIKSESIYGGETFSTNVYTSEQNIQIGCDLMDYIVSPIYGEDVDDNTKHNITYVMNDGSEYFLEIIGYNVKDSTSNLYYCLFKSFSFQYENGSLQNKTNTYEDVKNTPTIVFDYNWNDIDEQYKAKRGNFTIPNINETFSYSSRYISVKNNHLFDFSVSSLYLLDVNNDGFEDLCFTKDIGSGVELNQIMIYDFKNSTYLYGTSASSSSSNELLRIENGVLTAYKVPSRGAITTAYTKGTIQCTSNGDVNIAWEGINS